ncbi:isoprenyl transferase [Xanthobacteraceae bacterium A53D]
MSRADGVPEGDPAGSAPEQAGIPVHVGVIMDGNGRWATSRNLPRLEGHRRGVEALRRCVRAAREIGIRYLTIYSFSSENWSRPVSEVSDLMGLMRRFLRHDLAELHAANIKVVIIGERASLAQDLIVMLDEAEALTANNTAFTLVVAFNYGSRQEIADAAAQLASEVAAGTLKASDITPEMLGGRLSTAGIPDPDLIIRTSGEQRLSNFLMWQAAYAELVFLPIHWPDFDHAALLGAVQEFARRDRRFGGLTARTGS